MKKQKSITELLNERDKLRAEIDKLKGKDEKPKSFFKRMEPKRSIRLLDEIEELREEAERLKEPEDLQDQLNEAIKNEDYERASQIRDKLKNE